MFLVPLNCTLKNGYYGQFYVDSATVFKKYLSVRDMP